MYKENSYLNFSKLLPNSINAIILKRQTKQYKYIIKKNKFLFFLFYFTKNSLFKINQVLDIFCIDYLNILYKNRFQINYIFLSLLQNTRFYIKYNIKSFEAITTITNFFKSAGWLEREIWDLFGIFVLNHTDLRKILTDYGFQGYALRKDFPLSGYLEISYDIEFKKLDFNFIELSQEYRAFEFNSPWIIQKN